MGNFSRDPFDELRRSREQGYVGLHVEQGVPLLDRDLNLLADLVSSTVREILARHLGSGIAVLEEAGVPADDAEDWAIVDNVDAFIEALARRRNWDRQIDPPPI